MSTITESNAPPQYIQPKKPAPSETRNKSCFVVFHEARHETLPADVLRQQIQAAALSNARLLKLVDRSDRTWMDAWMNEPDPFPPA